MVQKSLTKYELSFNMIAREMYIVIL